jgi:hypothetical protein
MLLIEYSDFFQYGIIYCKGKRMRCQLTSRIYEPLPGLQRQLVFEVSPFIALSAELIESSPVFFVLS